MGDTEKKIFSLSFKEGMRDKTGDLGKKTTTICQVISKALYKYYYIQQTFQLNLHNN